METEKLSNFLRKENILSNGKVKHRKKDGELASASLIQYWYDSRGNVIPGNGF